MATLINEPTQKMSTVSKKKLRQLIDLYIELTRAKNRHLKYLQPVNKDSVLYLINIIDLFRLSQLHRLRVKLEWHVLFNLGCSKCYPCLGTPIARRPLLSRLCLQCHCPHFLHWRCWCVLVPSPSWTSKQGFGISSSTRFSGRYYRSRHLL